METGIYRTVWRWHFYAGLIVLPVLAWLAVTGGLYVYKPEIEAALYRDWSRVEPKAQAVPLDTLIARIEAQGSARVVQVMRPADAGASWRMTLKEEDGARRLAFVDPYRAKLLGTTTDGGIMQVVRSLHSLAITGPVGNAVVEIVAGWTVLLVISGIYLWWPRGGSPAIGLRGKPKGRMFWRDLHASTGFVAGAVILFLAITGMPWTGVGGAALQNWVAAEGLGRPKSPGPNPWEASGGHDHGQHDHGAKETLPWSMQAAAPPASQGGLHIGPEIVERIARSKGLSPPWSLTLPSAPDAPFLISKAVSQAQDARVLYFDAGNGDVLLDARYAQFGPGARAIEWGIATHQGQQYGEPNRLAMLAGCIAILLLAITAPILWWKRRAPGGRLSSPPRTADLSAMRGVALIMLAGGVLFPLTGLSMLAALLVDRLSAATRRVAPVG